MGVELLLVIFEMQVSTMDDISDRSKYLRGQLGSFEIDTCDDYCLLSGICMVVYISCFVSQSLFGYDSREKKKLIRI